MFTGIVETTATVASLELHPQGGHLILESVPFADELTLGESVAVNGCCLTVVSFSKGRCAFDLLGETLRLTNLGHLAAGRQVNLERAMRADTRFSGHFVQGHVDTTAEVLRYAAVGQDHEFTIRLPEGGQNLLVTKGSICLNGMSLTVAELKADQFTIWITPHTHQITTLNSMKAGDRVNVEFDMLAKYLERMLAARSL
jgi:riboflavin synthase